jgi:hypothetical protein
VCVCVHDTHTPAAPALPAFQQCLSSSLAIAPAHALLPQPQMLGFGNTVLTQCPLDLGVMMASCYC